MQPISNSRDPEEVIAALLELCDLDGLCYHLAESLHGGNPAFCDHTYRYTRQFLAEYSPDVNAGDVEALLGSLGAVCDCTVGFNVCGRYVDGA